MATKTTITISAKARAAFEAMRAEPPGLTLSDVYETAMTFWLAYGDHASLKPMIRHLSTVGAQITSLQRDLQHIRPPPIDHQRLGEIVAKQVVETLIPVIAPPSNVAGCLVCLGELISTLRHIYQKHTRNKISA
jgi:hypothetical protein